MTEMLEKAIAELRSLPESEHDWAADNIRFILSERERSNDYQLTPEQIEEVKETIAELDSGPDAVAERGRDRGDVAQVRRVRLRFSPKAERQLAAIARHIAKDNSRAAGRVLMEVRDAAGLLADFPESGRRGAVPATREWVVHGLSYILIYRPDRVADELAVLGVIHGARRR